MKPIPDYPEYSITRDGKVYSSVTSAWIKPRETDSGYLKIDIGRVNPRKTFYVHRLVASTYIPNNDPEKTFVNHKDSIKTNNSVDNLEWCTPKENTKHAVENDLIGRHVRGIEKLDLNGNVVGTFDSVKAAADSINCDPAVVRNVCSGKTKTGGGFKWRYTTPKDEVEIDNTWVDIPNVTGFKVSRNGEVYNTKHKRKLSPVLVDGYLRVTLNGTNYKVHRLVAAAFIPNPENRLVVNHKDGDKKNNRVENLEWATLSENTKHAHRIGAITSTGKKVHQKSKLDGSVVVHSSLASAAEKTKFSLWKITKMCEGKNTRKTEDGCDDYEWSFA